MNRFATHMVAMSLLPAVSPEKNREMSVKVAKNYFTRKITDFDTFTKIAKECRRFGHIIVAKGFEKLNKVQLLHTFVVLQKAEFET